MLDVHSFFNTYGVNSPSSIGLSVIDPDTFFQGEVGRKWEQGMDDFCQKHSDIPFNRGKLKAHIISLALEYYRKNETKEIGSYIERLTAPNAFALKDSEYCYDEEKTQSVVGRFFKIIALFFLNVVSLGIASIIWMNQNRQRMGVLNAKDHSLDQFLEIQRQKLGPQSNVLKRIDQISQEATGVEFEVEQKNKEKNTQQKIKTEKLQGRKECEQLLALTLQKVALEAQIAEYFAQQADNDELAMAMALSKKQLPVDGIECDFVGYVPSRYQKRDSDQNVIVGKFKDIQRNGPIQRGPDNLPLRHLPPHPKAGQFVQDIIITPSAEGKRVNGHKTMESLLNSVFDWATESLLDKAEGLEISFSNSSRILKASRENEQMALYKYMVYLMLDTASVNEDCTHIPHLELNKFEGGCLQVDPSVAYRAKKPGGEDYEILYFNQDGWTPKHPHKLPRGIDPIGAKWLMTRLKGEDEHINELEKRVLRPFQKHEIVEGLIDDDQVMKDIELADKLIEEIALSLKERYESLFAAKLSQFAVGFDLPEEIPPIKTSRISFISLEGTVATIDGSAEDIQSKKTRFFDDSAVQLHKASTPESQYPWENSLIKQVIIKNVIISGAADTHCLKWFIEKGIKVDASNSFVSPVGMSEFINIMQELKQSGKVVEGSIIRLPQENGLSGASRTNEAVKVCKQLGFKVIH